MVGVAGKSKGCNTCRNRKIAVRDDVRIFKAVQEGLTDSQIQCDQARPFCAQCTRSNRVCGGYQKQRTFVLVDPVAKQTHKFIRPQSLESRLQSGGQQTNAQSCELELAFANTSAITVRQTRRGTYSSPETSPAYLIIQRRAECLELIQIFLSHTLPSQWPSSDPRSWMLLLGTMATRSDVLEISSVAVATAVIGRKFQDPALFKASLHFYTRGLQQLQRALYDPELMKEDETLAACMALNLYEAIECPASRSEAYFNHCHGVIALIQARGASAHSSGIGHLLFLGTRIPEVSISRSELN